MEHSFNITLAKEYGIEESIVIHNFFFWICKNKANEKHFHDGRYWTYNTTKALSELFPYISESKMFRILKHLEDENFIVKGNYNEKKWDRTCWYSFTDNGLAILNKLGYSFDNNMTFQNERMHSSNLQNAFSQNEITIPYSNNTYNKHNIDNKENKDKSLLKKATQKFNFKQALLDLGVSEQTANDWLLVRKNKKATNSETAFNRLKKEIELTGASAEECIGMSAENSWMGFKAEWYQNSKPKKQEFVASKNNPYATRTELNKALYFIDKRGTLNDGTFVKDGFRYYLSQKDGMSYSIPPLAAPMPHQDCIYDSVKQCWIEDKDINKNELLF